MEQQERKREKGEEGERARETTREEEVSVIDDLDIDLDDILSRAEVKDRTMEETHGAEVVVVVIYYCCCYCH